MKHYEYEINLHFDGELDDEEQIDLYNHLSICRECRDNFNKYNQLRKEAKSVYDKNLAEVLLQPYEDGLPKQINSLATANTNRFYRIGFYASAAAAIVLLFLLATTKPKEAFVTKNEVRIDTVFVNKEIPITQNKITQAHSKTPGKRMVPIESSQKEYLRYVSSLRSERMTDAYVLKLN